MAFGGGAFAMQLYYKGGAFTNEIGVLGKRGPRTSQLSHLVRKQERPIVFLPLRGGLSPASDHAGTLISDFQPPEL